MKYYALSLFIMLSMSCQTAKQHDEYTTVVGVAHESKAGLEVNGVMLVNFPEEKYHLYVGKKVRVTGIVENKHPWKIKPFKKGEPVKQGFDMPVMRVVKGIEVVE